MRTPLAGARRHTALALVTVTASIGAYAAAARWSPPPREPVVGDRRASIVRLYAGPDGPPYLYFGSSAASEQQPRALDKRTLTSSPSISTSTRGASSWPRTSDSSPSCFSRCTRRWRACRIPRRW